MLTWALVVCSAAVLLGFFLFHRTKSSSKSSEPADAASETPSPRAAQPVLAPVPAGQEAGANEAEHSPRGRTGDEVLADASLPTLLDRLARDNRAESRQLSLRLIRRWAETDPRAAAAWVSQLPSRPLYPEAVNQIAIAWANQDLPGVLDWLSGLPEGAVKKAAILSVSYEASRTDAASALDLAASLAASPERDDFLVFGISQWASADPGNAVLWAQQVADPLRQRLLASAAISLAERDGAAAAELVATQLPPGDAQDRAAVAVAQRWVQKSPEAAASWVSQFPDGPTRSNATENLVGIWALQDSQAANRWVNALPQGPLRTAALVAYKQAVEPGQGGDPSLPSAAPVSN